MPVIGFVVNRMDSRSADYGYEYYGRYYGEKTQYDDINTFCGSLWPHF